MKSILEELYEGTINPSIQRPEDSPEHTAANEEYDSLLKTWQRSLSKEDFDRLDELISTHNYLGHFSDRGSFAFGFKLGTLLMVEVFTTADELRTT